MDLEYMICFYSFELDWKKHDGLISSAGETEQLNATKITSVLEFVYVKAVKTSNDDGPRPNHNHHVCLSFSAGKDVCNSYSYGVRAVIQCLPAWFRFIQCLRRYRDTKRAFPHLVNAGKYSTSFFVVTFAALYSTHKGRMETHIHYTSCCVQSTEDKVYTYTFIGISITQRTKPLYETHLY